MSVNTPKNINALAILQFLHHYPFEGQAIGLVLQYGDVKENIESAKQPKNYDGNNGSLAEFLTNEFT